MHREVRLFSIIVLAVSSLVSVEGYAQGVLLARGTLTGSTAGPFTDLSGLNYTLENGAQANLLGGLGSGLGYLSGNTFLAVPDRGPNAVSYNPLVDDTTSYISRFHTIQMTLTPNPGAGLPFLVTPELVSTTLLYSTAPLVYGTGELGTDATHALGSGVPPINHPSRHYFTGRSDDFDPDHNSGFDRDARLDPESIRASNDGQWVYISDEYGPYVYQFRRSTGQRIRVFRLPDSFYVANPNTTTTTEVAGNSSGRTPNKGMEGLAITPDGKTLVGMIQAPFIEDAVSANPGAKSLLRIVTIDTDTGETTHVYAYLLTTGSGVSEITAINDHQFMVDERDGKGLGDGSKAKIKHLFRIDLANAFDVSGMSGPDAASHAVAKTATPFIDLVALLGANGIANTDVPAKIEGLAFGPDVTHNGTTYHTLWVANDNDFVQAIAGPNQFFVIGLTDADLAGSPFVPQEVK